LLLALAAGCAGAPSGSSKPAPPAPAAAAQRTPARWLLTDRLGVMFDEAGHGSPVIHGEPAVVDGVRVVVEGGVITASARHADRLSGFRSIPARLGGGFVLWSEDRVYRADAFLGELKPIADVGAIGGARPWLSSILLRTPSGLLDLDPATLSIRRVPWVGIVDALAADGRRGARVDALGRATITLDGGRTFTDVLATRGARIEALSETGEGALQLSAATLEGLEITRDGVVRTLGGSTPPAGPDVRPTAPLLDAVVPASSRVLPGEIVAHAIAWGAPLPGGRALVTRENGVRVLSLESGLPVADTDLPAIDERFSRCQATVAGAAPALACSTATGAAVIALDGALARLSLDATFPGQDAGFVAGPRGRLAFAGRCGPEAPRGSDLGPSTPRLTQENGDSTPPPEASASAAAPVDAPEDEARVCVRAAPARWIERRLRGDDARRLYRWVPGEDGTVTALILTGKDDAADPDDDAKEKPSAPPPPSEPSPPSEGVRVIRLDPSDAALHGGAYPAVPAPQREVPYRVVEGDFWQDEDGAIRGWIKLPAEGEEKVPTASAEPGQKRPVLPVASARGGRSAGVRIDAAGRVTVLPLPEGVTEVVTGGPFALAMAAREGEPAWFETLDGGAKWTPIEAPPVGRLEPPPDDHAPHACSPLGCAFGNGMVRLGWGSAPPRAPEELKLDAAVNPKLRGPSQPLLSCSVDAAEPPWAGAAPKPAPPKPAPKTKPPAPKSTKPAREKPAAAKPGSTKKGTPKEKPHRDAPAAPAGPISIRSAAGALGELRGQTWTAEVVPPFQPTAAVRHVSASDPAFGEGTGSVVPVLSAKGRDPVDLLLLVDGHRLRAGAGSGLLPFAVNARFGGAVELAGGALALLEVDHDQIFLAQGAAVSAALALSRVPAVPAARFTLGLGPGGGLAVVGYAMLSGEAFAADVDLGRAEVGPLAALPRLDTLAACAAGPRSLRFLAEIPLSVRVVGAREEWLDQQLSASVLVAVGPERLCVEGVEVAVAKGRGAVLGALFGKNAVAAVRSGGKVTRAACSFIAR
jgi:hypothetical protein